MAILLFVGGLALVLVGAEALVRGASRLAAAFGVPSLVIGLTVVAWGTSAPELTVSALAALQGQADLAVGNVVGSNLFNVLVILGLSALVTPLVVHAEVVRIDLPLMIAASVATMLLVLDGSLGRGEGLALLAAGALHTLFLVRRGRAPDGGGGEPRPPRSLAHPLLVLGGLALLVLGSRWMVDGAVSMARWLGVSELVIGLTLVSAGTSVPEVATSVVAGLRGERDLAVGNVVGSNLFNLLAVLGLAGAIAPDGIPVAASVLRFDLPVMIAAAVACLPIAFTGHRIDRWEGVLLLAYYAAYVTFLVLTATGSAALPLLRTAMLGFALPLTALTLAIGVTRALRARTAGDQRPPR